MADLVEIGYRVRAEGLKAANKSVGDLLLASKQLDAANKKTEVSDKKASASKAASAKATQKATLATRNYTTVLKNSSLLQKEGFTVAQANKIATLQLAGARAFDINNLKAHILSQKKKNAIDLEAAATIKAQATAVAKQAAAIAKLNSTLQKEVAINKQVNILTKQGLTATQAKKIATYEYAGASKFLTGQLRAQMVAENQKLAALRKSTKIDNAHTAAIIENRKRIAAANKVAAASGGGMNVMGKLMNAAIIATAVISLTKLADTMTLLRSRAALVTPATETVNGVMGKLVDTAIRTRASLTDTVTLYNRLQPSLQRYGKTTDDVLNIVGAFNDSLLISGATARETSSAILQFSQSMAAGKLAGDEFRSVTEAAPELLRALSEGANIAREDLKRMSKEGKLTPDLISDALLKQMDKLSAKAAKIPINIQQAATNLKTRFAQFIDTVNQGTGITSSFARTINDIGEGLGRFTNKLAAGEYDKTVKSLGNIASLMFKLVGVYFTATTVMGLYTKAATLMAAANTLVASSATLATKSVKGLLFILGSFAVGFAFGEYLEKEFDEVKIAAVYFVKSILNLWERMKGYTKIAWSGLWFIITATIDKIRNLIQDFVGFTTDTLAKGLRLLGKDTLADKLEQWGKPKAKADSAKNYFEEIQNAHKEMTEGITKNNEITDQQLDDIYSKAAKRSAEAVGLAVPKKEAILTDFEKETKRLEKQLQLTLELGSAQQAMFRTQRLDAATTTEMAAAREELNRQIENTNKFLERQKELELNPFKEFENFDFESLFGDIGNPFKELTEGIIDAVDEMNHYQDILKVTEKDTKAHKAAEEGLARARVKGYADAFGSAKQFFSEGSKGYSIMEKSEKAFRAVEMAMAMKSLAVKLFATETATTATLGSVVPHTMAESAKAAASAVTAAVSSMAGLPFPLNIAALGATVAVLAALGQSVFGGGGGSSSGGGALEVAPVDPLIGTVLGQADDMSESLLNSLELLGDLSKEQNAYAFQMVQSLRNIEAYSNKAASSLIKSGFQGGISINSQDTIGSKARASRATSDISGEVRWLLEGFFYERNKTYTEGLNDMFKGVVLDISTQIDAGVRPESVEYLPAREIWYAVERSMKALEASNFPTEMRNGLDEVTRAISGGLGLLGLSGDVASMQGISLPDLHILEGDTGEQITEKINAFFSNVGDNIVSTLHPALMSFQRVGEGGLETLTRLGAQVTVLKEGMSGLGASMSTLSPYDMIFISNSLSDMAGGLSDFSNNFSSFLDFVLTEEEQTERLQKSVGALFSTLGMAIPNTVFELKNLVKSLNLTTESGKTAFTAITSSTDLLGEYYDNLENQNKKIEDFTKQIGGGSPANGSAELSEVLNTVGISLAHLKTIAQEGAPVLQSYLLGLDDITKSALSPFLDELSNLVPEFTILEEAVADTKDIMAERIALERELFEMQATQQQLRDKELESIDASNHSLKLQIWALEDQKEAAEAATKAQEELNKAQQETASALLSAVQGLLGFVKELRDEANPQTLAQVQREFFSVVNKAKGGDLKAAEQVITVGKSLISMAGESATSKFEYDRILATVSGGATSAARSLAEQIDPTYLLQEEQLTVLQQIRDTLNGVPLTGANSITTSNAPLPASDLQFTGTTPSIGDTQIDRGDQELIMEIRGLRSDLRDGHAVIALNTGRVAKILKRVDDGDALLIREQV